MDPRQLNRRGAVDAEAQARDAAATAQDGPLLDAWNTGLPRPRRRKEPELGAIVVGTIVGQDGAGCRRRGFGLLRSDVFEEKRCYAGLVFARDQILGYRGRIFG